MPALKSLGLVARRPEGYEWKSIPLTFKSNRVCQHPGCDTILSKYNPADYCSLHESSQYYPPSWQPEVNHKGERRCPGCGRWLLPYLVYWRADKHSGDSLSLVCISCMEGYAKDPQPTPEEIAVKNREKRRARQRRYYLRKKEARERREKKAAEFAVRRLEKLQARENKKVDNGQQVQYILPGGRVASSTM